MGLKWLRYFLTLFLFKCTLEKSTPKIALLGPPVRTAVQEVSSKRAQLLPWIKKALDELDKRFSNIKETLTREQELFFRNALFPWNQRFKNQRFDLTEMSYTLKDSVKPVKLEELYIPTNLNGKRVPYLIGYPQITTTLFNKSKDQKNKNYMLGFELLDSKKTGWKHLILRHYFGIKGSDEVLDPDIFPRGVKAFCLIKAMELMFQEGKLLQMIPTAGLVQGTASIIAKIKFETSEPADIPKDPFRNTEDTPPFIYKLVLGLSENQQTDATNTDKKVNIAYVHTFFPWSSVSPREIKNLDLNSLKEIKVRCIE